ncbi:MAG: sulfatase-like hydrolase/transferase [Kiritimatiellae bacterium]|nr:sulfatase-like hydrolase/transferase [Kiritimatiellia bacterium]
MKKPNILLLFSDQHNAGVLGCEGHPDVKTPALDRLACTGVRFTRAYCQDGICVPSRASMMTGQYPRTVGVLYNTDPAPMPERFEPLPAMLRRNGYRTGAFGKRHMPRSLDGGWDIACTTLTANHDPSDEYYREWIEQRGKQDAFLRDWRAETGGAHAAPMASLLSDLAPEETMEAYTAQKTIAFLEDAAQGDRPFFAWCSFYRPHQPYTPLPMYADMYEPSKIRMPDSLREPAENLPPLLQHYRSNEKPPWCLGRAAENEDLYRMYIAYYYALVTEIDHHVDAVISALERLGLADNTIVIYTSDHGDFVGAHGMIEKIAHGHNIYEDTLRVPLIVSWPGKARRGAVVDDLVELVDLYPTLLDMAGIDPPDKPYSLPGRSLTPTLVEGAALGREYAVSENWSQVSVIGRDHKLGVWIAPPKAMSERPRHRISGFRDFGDMLFDRNTDPLELTNIAGKPEAAAVEKDLRAKLAEWEKKTPADGKDAWCGS